MFNFPDPEGDVEFVTKNINDSATENYKNRLDNDIHKFSFVPNMSDENFASNASGVAMQYKLAGLNYKTAIKEALFKKGLLRRIELISHIINITSNDPVEIIQDVDIKFQRNTIDNLMEQADLANKVANLISKEGTIELLRDIIDPETEKERVKAELEEWKETYYEDSDEDVDIEQNKEEQKPNE